MPSPNIVLLDSWPQPSGAPEAIVFATETQLELRYWTDGGETAVVHFPCVKKFQFGSPNDEALGGHPLSELGLRYYSVHRVENSPWITELEARNSVHPRHDRDVFLKDTVHYVFTFQDSTLECVVKEGESWHPKIQVFPADKEANVAWKNLIEQLSQ